ncbi:hypothetical protein [Myxococcus landrumensis]|uniref:Uncharacterized protein n=1 Tax=Myxococcus landrumensis TaxID=2813577 RepID=A0ABX7N1E2_9BACT|nr:hypothetical protein [Myxococcus landrumus]QSQ11221.1 hypothetical protein JY572_22655 [Myxococcus landrumus]
MLRRASPIEGTRSTADLLGLLGQRHESPRGPGKRWRDTSVRMNSERGDADLDDGAVDDEAAIASW